MPETFQNSCIFFDKQEDIYSTEVSGPNEVSRLKIGTNLVETAIVKILYRIEFGQLNENKWENPHCRQSTSFSQIGHLHPSKIKCLKIVAKRSFQNEHIKCFLLFRLSVCNCLKSTFLSNTNQRTN